MPEEGGGGTSLQFLADQLPLFQPGGADYAHNITTVYWLVAQRLLFLIEFLDRLTIENIQLTYKKIY